ncbi:MAG: hypothetical protein ABFD91_13395 [Anaerohalosphaeraceae bacterium]
MKMIKQIALAVLVIGVGCVWAETAPKVPNIGYLYPAGTQQGTTIQITVGGRNLRGVKEVYVSGEGVKASVVTYQGRLKSLNQQQRDELNSRLRQLRQRYSSSGQQRRVAPPAPKNTAPNDPNAVAVPAVPVKLPDHPMLRNLDKLCAEGLQKVVETFIRPNLNQISPQIAETVVIEITADADAASGDREIRLGTSNGLTNPMRFEIGTLPEIREPDYADPGKRVVARLTVPSVINGQILPGEVDRFRFQGKQGQKLVIETHARRLIPYLGDAVPGWFQATLSLSDAAGDEVAFADDFRFDPDPVLYYEIPQDGDYILTINDAIYRGRADFVYRIAVAQQPFFTSIFPLGGPPDKPLTATAHGWNLSEKKIKLDTRANGSQIRSIQFQHDGLYSNPVVYAVDTLPESDENEDNNTLSTAQKIDLPCIINGQVDQSGDMDIFCFEGQGGQQIVMEVDSRRLHSPLDSLIRLKDADGKMLAWNDDCEDKESGLMTHYADSYLMYTLPQDGAYYVCLTDSQSHGGDDYGYRLRLSFPRPDFSVYVDPASLTIPAGRSVPINVHVFRRDGFGGDVELTLRDAPKGFVLSGGQVPAGQNDIRMTLTAPANAGTRAICLQFQARAEVDGKPITRLAVPCQDMMQAFIYRHYVPSKDFMVAVTGIRRNTRSSR